MPFAGRVSLAERGKGVKFTACEICGSTDWRFALKSRDRLYHLDGEFDLFRCRGCGLLAIFPFLDGAKLGSYYPENYYSYSDSEKEGRRAPAAGRARYFARHPLKALNSLLYSRILGQNRDEKVRPGGAVLDVGCGDGRYLLKKKSEGAACSGVDIGRGAIERLKKAIPDARVFCGNLWEAGFPEASFDLVNLCHVLEHVQSTGLLVAEIRRLLKPGGRLRVQVPNASSVTFSIFGRYWMALDTPRHVYVFSRANLRLLFERAGFRVLSVRTMENSFSLLGCLVYVWNALTGRRYELMKMEKWWDNEFLKLVCFPYAFLVNLFGAGDSIELVLEKPGDPT